jgi:hypothetical protein
VLDRLLEVLTFCVRLLATPQAEEIVSASTIRRAIRDGLLVSIPTLVYWPPLSLAKPLALWKPGMPHEDAGAISYLARRRWRGMGTAVVPLLVATQKAAKITGGIGRGEIVQGLQATHDMHMWEIYKQIPETAQEKWLGEDILRGQGWLNDGKLPDAVITEPRIAIEFAGSYSTPRVREFIRFCEREEELPYAIF